MTIKEYWHRLFPTQEQKARLRIKEAVRRSKEYIYIAESDSGTPAIFISDLSVFYISDSETNLEDRVVNINDVQKFLESIRETYIHQHQNDELR